eukprot:EG_transcript_13008
MPSQTSSVSPVKVEGGRPAATTGQASPPSSPPKLEEDASPQPASLPSPLRKARATSPSWAAHNATLPLPAEAQSSSPQEGAWHTRTVKHEKKELAPSASEPDPYLAIRQRPPALGDRQEFLLKWERYCTFGYRTGRARGSPKRRLPIARYAEVWPTLQRLYSGPRTPEPQMRTVLSVLRQIEYFETTGLFQRQPLPWVQAIDCDAEMDDVRELDVVTLRDDHGWVDADAAGELVTSGSPSLPPAPMGIKAEE